MRHSKATTLASINQYKISQYQPTIRSMKATQGLNNAASYVSWYNLHEKERSANRLPVCYIPYIVDTDYAERRRPVFRSRRPISLTMTIHWHAAAEQPPSAIAAASSKHRCSVEFSSAIGKVVTDCCCARVRYLCRYIPTCLAHILRSLPARYATE